MSPDIIAGPSGLAGAAPNAPVGGAVAVTGPPGLAALFAALLAERGSPQTNTAASSAAKKTEPPANASLSVLPTPLPIKNQTKNQILTKPTTPPSASAPAKTQTKTQTKTQNAMDTVPVSVSPQAKSKESKPGGELPLPGARTAAPVPLPVFPGLLILAPVTAPVVTGTDSVKAPPSAALPQAAAPQLRVFSLAAPAAVALQKTTSTPPEGEAQVITAPAPVPAQAVAAIALPVSSLVPNPGRKEAALLGELTRATAVAASSVAPTEAVNIPYVVTPQVFMVPIKALAEPARPAAAMAKSAAVLLSPAALPPKAAPAVFSGTTVSAAPDVNRTPVVSAQPAARLPLTLAAATAQQPVVALPIDTVAAASVPPVAKTETVSENNTVSPVLSATGKVAAPMGTSGPMENPLKTQPAPADNNARVQAASTIKTPPVELQLQVVGKRSERRAVSDTSEIGDSAAAIPIQPAAASADAAKPAAAPLTHAEREQVVRQAADAVQAVRPPAKPGATQQMTLQLHPKDWGQLQISVRVDSVSHADAAPNAAQTTVQTQTVTAHVIAETPQVKAALENGAGELRLALREAGLHLNRLTVTVQSAGASGQAGMTSGHHQTGSNNSGFGQSQGDTYAGGADSPAPGTSRFAAFAGSSGGRHDSQPQPAHTGAYTEPERDEPREWDIRQTLPRQPGIGRIDMQA